MKQWPCSDDPGSLIETQNSTVIDLILNESEFARTSVIENLALALSELRLRDLRQQSNVHRSSLFSTHLSRKFSWRELTNSDKRSENIPLVSV